WTYLSANTGGKSHIWRQQFPEGAPQQVTTGATEEEGIAMAPDGKSFITSVGTTDATLWIHDDKGEHQITSQGSSENSWFSNDATRLYYLNFMGQGSGNELWVADLATGKSEKVLPGYSIDQYAVSRDGKRIVFSQTESNGRSSLWTAPTDHRSSPR